jgi:hypothetical protein
VTLAAGGVAVSGALALITKTAAEVDPGSAGQYGVAAVISALCAGIAAILTAAASVIKARNAHPARRHRRSRARTRQQLLAQQRRIARELEELEDAS